jgi:hypothetical protein
VALTNSRPGKRIDVAPAAAGRAFVSVTVNGAFSVTIKVGPGTCIVLHVPLERAAGAKVAVPLVQP